MKVLSVVGARPQFVKLAPVAEAFAEAGLDHVIVHTGQHYDAGMSDVFFEDLRIPAPDVSLGIGSASHGAQTGAMLAAIEPVLQEHSPDWVLVYGDTNSTLAGALAAVKLHLPVAHLEAGLRSFNRRMPEEHNRVLTDHAADLLLAPTRTAMDHLDREGLSTRSELVGDVMADVCLRVARGVDGRDVGEVHPSLRSGNYLVSTLHRAENTDDPGRLGELITALQGLPVPVVLPVHPRLRDTARRLGIKITVGSLIGIDPVPYPDMVLLMSRALGVVTDSGGLQKEAFLLQVPCTTLRTETEWTETLGDGWNVLCPSIDPLAEVALRGRPSVAQQRWYGSGEASQAVTAALVRNGDSSA